jgi:gamma-glutamylcyclotransferase (GGCT)/AIG2-like uncharacterized protein YtfP
MARKTTRKGKGKAARVAKRRDMRTIRVFTYGSLLRGFGNHRLLETNGAEFVGVNATAEHAFRMYDYCNGGFPAVCRTDRDGESIVGECYRVNAATLARLDALEGHPDFYRREPVRMADGSIAWTYLIDAERLEGRGLPRVLGGSWADYCNGVTPEPVVVYDDEPESDDDEPESDDSDDDDCVGGGDCEVCGACIGGPYYFEPEPEPEPTILYFAYGSNLDLGQMQRRCPGSRLVGRGKLDGLRLAFAGHSKSWGGAVATVVPERGGACDGLVFACTPSDVRRLDACEGFPYCYDRRRFTVRLDDGTTCKAWTYFLPLTRKQGDPSDAYLSQIWNAYRTQGFDVDVLVDATVNGNGRAA